MNPQRIHDAGGEPAVALVDARPDQLDEAGLREWVRGDYAYEGAAHSSRSYRYPFAVVATHRLPVGVDIERITPYDRAFTDSICTPRERELARPALPESWQADLWSSKEAMAKALGDAVSYDPRRLEAPSTWPAGTAAGQPTPVRAQGRWRARALTVPGGHVGWLVWQAA